MYPIWTVPGHPSFSTTASSAGVTSYVSFRDISWFCPGKIYVVALTIMAAIAVLVNVYYLWKTFGKAHNPAWRRSNRRLSRSVEFACVDIPDIMDTQMLQPNAPNPVSDQMVTCHWRLDVIGEEEGEL
ncbi:uncharacterized protein [Haliotis cracherodii]|uniref:uncharacterized protein n=1 Tax=Haliotis cracherodii TaxID=6455 RepID=UPI0039EB0292